VSVDIESRRSQMTGYACSLDAREKADCAEAWRRLRRDALLGVRDDGVVVTSTWRRSAEVRRRLDALIEAESACCSFIDFELDERADTLVLRATAPAGAEPVARLIAGLE
jgi:hypothetical protein